MAPGLVQVNLRLSAALFARLEEARGLVARNAWIVAAVEGALPDPDPPAADGRVEGS